MHKLVVLVLGLRLRWSWGPLPTALQVAEDASLHRVTVQRMLTDLRRRGILVDHQTASEILWDFLTVTRAATGATQVIKERASRP